MSSINFIYLQSVNSSQELKKYSGFSFSLITKDAELAYKHAMENNVDAVVVEIDYPTAESYEFIDKLSFLKKRPLICVVSALQDESYYTRARRLGARLVYRSPYNLDTVFEEMLGFLKDNKELHLKSVTDKATDERLAHIFISSGIPPHIKGYQFLREAVKQAVQNPAMINNITKELYPTVAAKFNTTSSKVERAIRHAIDVAWSRGKIENINSIYGIKVFAKGEKPTNGELIALISDKMIIESNQ